MKGVVAKRIKHVHSDTPEVIEEDYHKPSFDSEARDPDEILTDVDWGKSLDASEPEVLPIPVSSKVPTTNTSDVISYDPLQSYLSEIKNIPVLTQQQELELATRYKIHGDKQAALKLVVANLRLVVMIAREHQRNVQNILDLVQEGNIGLLEAVEKYDPTKGIRFPSYAVYWIRAYILRYLINNIRLVKIGTTQAQRKLFFNLVKEKEKLEKEGFVPEAKMLAERLGVKESEVLEMEQRLSLPDVSVDAPMKRGEDDALDLHGYLPSDDVDQETYVADKEFTYAIRDLIDEYKKNADEKEIAIIERRLLSDEPETLQDIADSFAVSRERIRQIETRLKARLKSIMEKKLKLDEDGVIDVSDYEKLE